MGLSGVLRPPGGNISDYGLPPVPEKRCSIPFIGGTGNEGIDSK